MISRDRLVVRTLRCARINAGSNPGTGMSIFNSIHVVRKLSTEVYFLAVTTNFQKH